MTEPMTKEARLTAEVQHLALDLYALGPDQTPPFPAVCQARAELADTLTTKMLALGPLRNKQGGHFQALGERLFQFVQTAPARSEVYDMANPGLGDWQWLCALALAEPCTKDEFLTANADACRILSGRVLARRPEPRAALRPINTARYTTEVWVSDDHLPAFKQVMREQGGIIEDSRPQPLKEGMTYGTRCTISVDNPADLFNIGRMMVLTHHLNHWGGGQPT